MASSEKTELLEFRKQEEAAFASGDWAALAEALGHAAQAVADAAEKAGTLCRAAVAARRAGNEDRALELFRMVAGDARWERLARISRLELHWRRSEWNDYIAVLDEQLQEGAAWDAESLQLEKARVMAVRMGMVEEAVALLDAILADDPSCREALWLEIALALRSGNWERSDELYRRLYELSGEDQDVAMAQSLALRLAQINELRFHRPEEAAKWYEKIEHAGSPVHSLYPLFELAEARADWPEARARLEGVLAAQDREGEQDNVPALRLLLARIKEDGTGELDSAVEDLRRMVQDFPDDLGVVYAAEELARETNDPAFRADLDEKAAAMISDPQAAALFMADRTRLLIEDLDDPAAAAESARKWAETAPDDLGAGRWLIEALVRSGETGAAIAALDRESGRTKDPREKQALLIRLAELAALKQGDHAAALEAYRAALEVPPSQFPILMALARLYHLNRDWENLSRVLTASMKLVVEPPVKKFYQGWLAGVMVERLARDDQAFALYGEMIKADPSDRIALDQIARLGKRKGSWPNLKGALARIADSVTDDKLKAEVKARIAWITELRLAQQDQALAIYKELAGTGHGFAREAVRRLTYQSGDLAGYAGVMDELTGEVQQGQLRAARLCRLAAAREILGDLSDAWAAYEKAKVSLMPEPHLYLPMIDLAQLSGYWGRYVNLVEEFAGRLSDKNKRAMLWESAWSKAELPGADGNVDAAAMLRSFQGLEEAAPGWQAALRGAWLASVWAGDHRARADLLARMIKHMPEDAALPIRAHLAFLLRDDLGASEEAIAVLRQVLAKDQKSLPVIRELALMYEQAGQWGELIRMMLMEIPLRKDPGLLIDLYQRLAKHYEENFQALDEAIKCHQAILRMAPGLISSHQERARLLEAKGRWEDLADALAAYEAAAQDRTEKVLILVKAARICDEKLNSPDRAIESLKKALDLDPSRAEILQGLSTIYEREQKWPDLVEILLRQADRVEDNSVKAVLIEQVASISEQKIGDPAKAIEHLIIARDLDPSRTSVLLSLERLFTAAGRWEELVDTLERLAGPADAAAQVGYYSRVGALWDEKLRDLQKSVASWERVRGLDPANIPAHEALVSLYERTADDALFVDRSAALAELVAADQARAVDILIKAGAVTEQKLSDDGRALGLYARAMEIDASSLPPIAAARAVRERREEWPEVIALLLSEEGIAEAIARKVELMAEVGRINEDKIKDEAAAANAYENALALQGDYLPAVAPLSEIHFKGQAWQKARPLFEIRTAHLEGQPDEARAETWFKAGWCAEQTADVGKAMPRYHSSVEAVPDYRPSLERLSELYCRQEKWEPAASFTERLLAVARKAEDTPAIVMLLNRQGLVEEKLGRLDKATLAYEQALEIKPGDYPTLQKLVDLYLRQEQWKKALTAYDLLIRSAPNSGAAATGLYGKGIVLEEKLQEEASALAHFKKAVEVQPAHLKAWERLAAIHLRKLSWPEAEQALSQLLKLEKDKTHLVAHNFSLGRVYMEGMADLARARKQFEAALGLDPVHIPSMQALGDIYLKQEEWGKFIDTSEKFVRLVAPEAQQDLIPTFFKMGEVYRDHLKNTERSIIQFQQVIKYEPDNEKARSELAALYISDPKFIDQAKSENLSLIRLHPWRVQTYRDLAQIYKGQRNLDAQFWIYSIENLLGTLDYEEQMFYDVNKDKAVTSSKRTLKQMERDSQLLHPDERGPLHDMLGAMADSMQKQFPPPLQKYGATKSNLLTEKSASPIKDLAIEIAINLGIEDMNIYLVPQALEPQVFATTPPSLVINTEWFNRLKPLEQRFIMGRSIERLINGHGLVQHFPPEKVIQTLCLIAMGADPGIQINLPGVSPSDLEKEKKNARKLIPRKAKGMVETAAQRFTQDVLNLDPAKWKKAMDHTANRAGLLVCGDIKATFDAIIKTDPRYKNVKYDELGDPMALWEKNEDIVELLVFSVSDSFFRLRTGAGFAIV